MAQAASFVVSPLDVTIDLKDLTSSMYTVGIIACSSTNSYVALPAFPVDLLFYLTCDAMEPEPVMIELLYLLGVGLVGIGTACRGRET